MLDLLGKDATFKLGNYRILREGSDVLLLAHGVMVEKALAAAALLEKDGISAKVASVSTMKPFNYQGARELARGMKGVVTAEEHSYIGGLAAAMAFALRRSSVPMDYVAVKIPSASLRIKPEDLQTAYGLTAENIAGKARNLGEGSVTAKKAMI